MAGAATILELMAGRDAGTLLGDGVRLDPRALLDRADGLARTMAGAGATRNSRIALVTRNGPDAALLFLAATLVAVAAPLNPAYTRAEFEFSLRDLPAALLVSDGAAPAASEAAAACGVPELRLAGGECSGPTAAYQPPAPGDVALVLHTSGTTGAPKRVPLTHANLTVSAANIARTLQLGPCDRCLNVMPLFHIHGLVGAVLSSLSAGAEVVCTPGFDAFQFWRRLEDARPTWYTAVPSMHQAILARAPEAGAHASLRFARSASSSLPPVLLAGLEDRLGVPVIEAYGMTEAAHQVASNPLPPAERRPGSVGSPGSVEVSVFDSAGHRLSPGERGEVGIRGPSVTAGYEGIDPNTTTFPDGWLRTGDEGRIDADGYLWLTGRIKELINRGGEKVSPVEVEAVLLKHPGIAQVAVFAVPNDVLGQEVAAAIVPADPATPPATADIRRFAGEELAPFKVPRKIVFLDSLPLGPTGKPQRSSMAERLGLA